VSDCISKSTIRIGIEAAMTQRPERVFYWPSFEMVRWLAPHRGGAFGIDGADNRHISPAMIDEIMSLFLSAYFR
jgi:hypothetical protein